MRSFPGRMSSPTPQSLLRARRPGGSGCRPAGAAAGLATAALLLALVGPYAAQAAAPPPPDTLRVVFSPDKFSAVNRNDALASFKVWIETVGRRRGINVLVQSSTYETEEELRQLLRRRAADLLIIRSLPFLELGREQALLEPKFMAETGDGASQRYCLLTRRAPHLSLSDLRGRKINILTAGGASLGRTWLAELLREHDLGPARDFCAAAEDVTSPSAAILPVYFGKADACVVEASRFAVMQELNPQLGQALEVCETSPAYLESVICIRRDEFEHKGELVDGLASLHEEPAGRQMLMVFKVGRLLPFEEQALDSVRDLRARAAGGTGVASR